LFEQPEDQRKTKSGREWSPTDRPSETQKGWQGTAPLARNALGFHCLNTAPLLSPPGEAAFFIDKYKVPYFFLVHR
jgi:hypothetical protein